jgi:hypothetical protein
VNGAKDEADRPWYEEVTAPGLYVDLRSGALFRIPEEALLGRPADAPARAFDTGAIIKLSDDPFLSPWAARRIAAKRGLRIGFERGENGTGHDGGAR